MPAWGGREAAARPGAVAGTDITGPGRDRADGTRFESREGVRIDPAHPAAWAPPPHLPPHPPGGARASADPATRLALRLIGAVERAEGSPRAPVSCEPEGSACRTPLRLAYWEYLERQNIAHADVSQGLLPGQAGPIEKEPADQAGVAAAPGQRPSYAMPHLGDVPTGSTEVVRRVAITERREAFDPLGNVIDVFA